MKKPRKPRLSLQRVQTSLDHLDARIESLTQTVSALINRVDQVSQDHEAIMRFERLIVARTDRLQRLIDPDPDARTDGFTGESRILGAAARILDAQERDRTRHRIRRPK